MNELAGLTTFVLFLAVIVLGLAAVLMPIAVFLILNHVGRISSYLAAMEHMMRHGK